ncbi:MAG: ferrous iron transport protein B [Oscillospiraceae bacterium]|nr:ferrous iron transport protein B [Oscillospiraceae bacterium]
MTFAIAGNPNCGKTTLFNRLTGASRRTGNFPGVTVECKKGRIRHAPDCQAVDLPGIYSILPYSGEERVAYDYLNNNNPDGIINIVDAANIERNLYLTLQLIELNKPTVLALNMMDEVRVNGGFIDIDLLSQILGIPVIPISAAKNEGIDELVKAMTETAQKRILPKKSDFITESKTECTSEQYAVLAEIRYNFIEYICSKTVTKPRETREHKRSTVIDRLLTNKILALPIFFIIMATVFWLTFDVIGELLSDLLRMGMHTITETIDKTLTIHSINPILHSLIIDGVFKGIGSVLSFLPIIITLFFFLSMLEDSGYMARIAFIMDKPLRQIGLSGRSFVPMLIGFGCTVPAIMATRTLPSERDRVMTILLTPFMSCSAKIPIYAVFAAAFFDDNQALVMFLLYSIGILTGIILGAIFNKTHFRGNAVPFIMELPNYRLPSAKTTFLLMWDKARDFLARAFTIILVATIIIWFLRTLDIHFNIATTADESILAHIGRLIVPIFTPLGFTDWRAATALLTGFTAKEAVISTLAVLTGADLYEQAHALSAVFTDMKSVFTFLTFTLLYTPCIAAIAAIRRELRSVRMTVAVIFGQCAIAWIVAFLIGQPIILTIVIGLLCIWGVIDYFTKRKIPE